jgi:hypothetical protein
MGDTEVENAVEPDETFNPADGIDVTVNVLQGANVRSGPGLNFNVVGGVGGERSVQADGQSEDGDWLRIAYNNRPAWISKTVLVEDPAFDELPILSPDLRTSMQAFFLRTGVGQPECEGIPEDMLFVQVPNGIEIELDVNGANVTIGSSIGLRTITINGELFLELIVFSGGAEVDGVSVPVGYSTLMCLSEPDNRGMDSESNDRIVSCAPSTPEPVDDFGGIFCYLEELPASLMSYQIEVLCPGETPPPSTDTSSNTTNASPSEIGSVDCSTFGLVSPTDGIVSRPTDFVWTEAPGATRYEVVFYGGSGEVAETFFTENTTINLNTGSIPTGSEVGWEVRAYGEEGYACVTQRTPTFTRTVDPAFEPPLVSRSGDFSASILICDYPDVHEITIGWDGLADGESATFKIQEEDGSGNATRTRSSENGTVTLTLNTFQRVIVTVTTTDGENLTLGSCDAPL